MRSTGEWVFVRTGEGLEPRGARMLHIDSQGRPVVRLDRQWWLVERKNRELGFGHTYVTVGRE